MKSIDSAFSAPSAVKKAWQNDIFNGRELLTEYARESPSEGFAEAYRVLVEHGADHVKTKLPNVHKFLKKEGLL